MSNIRGKKFGMMSDMIQGFCFSVAMMGLSRIDTGIKMIYVFFRCTEQHCSRNLDPVASRKEGGGEDNDDDDDNGNVVGISRYESSS
jgi:hypothetical protein